MEMKRRSCDHDAFPLAVFPRLGSFEVLPRVASYTYAPSSPVFLLLFNPRTLGLMGNVVLTPLCGSKTMLFCPEGPSSPGRATENQPGRRFSSWTCEPSVRFQPQFQPPFQIQEGEKDAASCSSSQPEADPSPQPAVQPVALLFLGAYARCVSSPFPDFPSFGGRKMLFRCTSPLTDPTRPWELTMSS